MAQNLAYIHITQWLALIWVYLQCGRLKFTSWKPLAPIHPSNPFTIVNLNGFYNMAAGNYYKSGFNINREI